MMIENKINKASFLNQYASKDLSEKHPDSKNLNKLMDIVEKTKLHLERNGSREFDQEEQKSLNHYSRKNSSFLAAVQEDQIKPDEQLEKMIDSKVGDVIHIKKHIIGHDNYAAMKEFHSDLDKPVPDHLIRIESNKFNPIKVTHIPEEMNHYEHLILHPGKYIKTKTTVNDYNEMIHHFNKADDDFEETK